MFLQIDEAFENEDDQEEDEVPEGLLQEDNTTVDSEEVLSEISQLSNAKIIDDEVGDHLAALHRALFKKVENSALPMYELQMSSSSRNTNTVILSK